MGYINTEAFDGGLDYIDVNGSRVDLTVGEAANYTQATSIYNGSTQLSCAYKTGMAIPVPSAPTSGTGRAIIVPAITDGTVSDSQTATHWALTDNSGILLAAGPLNAGVAVVVANTFTLTSFEIIIRQVA